MKRVFYAGSAIILSGLLNNSYPAVSKGLLPPPARPEIQNSRPELKSDTGTFTLSFGLDSLLASQSPYTRVDSGTLTNFGTPLPQNLSLEVGYRPLQRILLAASVGYASLQSRITQAGNRVDTVTFRELPKFRISGRYEFLSFNSGQALDFEGALGLGFGRLRISSTDTGVTEINEKQNSFTLEPLIGWNVAWNSQIFFRLAAGYSLQNLGQKTLANSLFTVNQASSYSGFLVRSQIGLQF